MSIFTHITKEHLEKAIELYGKMSQEELLKYGLDPRPTKNDNGYEVFYDNKLYPLKRLMRIADKISINDNLPRFNTHSARNHLAKLDFTIIISRKNESGEIIRKIYGSDKIFFETNIEENLYPDEINEPNNCHSEGAKKQVTVNAYERNQAARKECLKTHGYSCKICGFSFGEKYGEEFQYKIHVHHIVPLSEIQKTYEVDPIKDLIPVCPNCHMILHSKGNGETYSIDEVKAMLA